MKSVVHFGILVPAIFILSACGGGGGGISSTPAPPTSGPTPTPPTPAPTPPPTTANTDLIALSKSESFTNDGASGSASYPKIGAGAVIGANGATIEIVYDAQSRTYKITNGTRSQSFAPGAIDALLSNSKQTVYKVVNGSTTDTLTLNKPGTDGSLTYQYVGGGFWQRTSESSTNISGTIDAFSYGVETPDNDLPRTGNIQYDVDLLGVEADSSALYSLLGTGSLSVDFMSGQISASGDYNRVLADSGAAAGFGLWDGRGQLSSTKNLFNGGFAIGGQTSGIWNGRFYGPGAEEVGAAFWSSQAGGSAFAGVVLGRISPVTSNINLIDLKFDTQFKGRTVFQTYALQPDGTLLFTLDGTDPGQLGGFRNFDFSYRASDNSFQFQPVVGRGGGAFRTSAANFDAGASDARFNVYSKTTGNTKSTLKLSTVGAGNPDIELTYVGFGSWQRNENPDPQNRDYTERHFFYYGLPIPSGPRTDGAIVELPRSGSATYNGIVAGTAAGSTTGQQVYDLFGTVLFNANFATSVFTGNLDIDGTSLSDGSIRDFGKFPFANGTIFGGGEPYFSGALTQSGVEVGYTIGDFFGRMGQEIGGAFAFRTGDPNVPGSTLYGNGVFVGKR